MFSFTEISGTNYKGLSDAIKHWPERPQARKLVYTGAACLTVAAVIGYHFGVIP